MLSPDLPLRGGNTTNQTQFNVNGGWDYGWHFNNKLTAPDATVYFPAVGYRHGGDGWLVVVGRFAWYKSAVPIVSTSAADFSYCTLYFYHEMVMPLHVNDYRSSGHSVRPVRE